MAFFQYEDPQAGLRKQALANMAAGAGRMEDDAMKKRLADLLDAQSAVGQANQVASAAVPNLAQQIPATPAMQAVAQPQVMAPEDPFLRQRRLRQQALQSQGAYA